MYKMKEKLMLHSLHILMSSKPLKIYCLSVELFYSKVNVKKNVTDGHFLH
jgi:transcriptional antiterminator